MLITVKYCYYNFLNFCIKFGPIFNFVIEVCFELFFFLMQVGWDESTAGERQPRVSLWEIEPLTTFPMYPSPFPMRLKRPWPSGLPSFHGLIGLPI